MTIVILLVLAVAWAAMLVPPWLRSRTESSANHSIVSFRQHLSTLQRATPAGRNAALSAHASRSAQRSRALRRTAARHRRRDILRTLAAATALTLVMALVLQGAAVIAFLAAATLLVAYTGLLIRARKRSLERAKVKYLVTRRSQPELALLLRRSASN